MMKQGSDDVVWVLFGAQFESRLQIYLSCYPRKNCSLYHYFNRSTLSNKKEKQKKYTYEFDSWR